LADLARGELAVGAPLAEGIERIQRRPFCCASIAL
jgi:hypothetical protein